MNRSVRVARNIATTLISQIISWGLTFAVILYLPRYAGARGLGEITLATAFSGMFGLISSLGVGTVMMRDIPRDLNSAGRLILASLILRLPLGIVGVGVGVVIGELFGYGNQAMLLIGIGLAGTVAVVISDTLGSALRGLENFSVANVGVIIDKFSSSALNVAVCILRWPLWLIMAAPVFSCILSCVYMYFALRASDIEWKIPDAADLKSLVLAGIPFISASVFVALYAKSDAIFLSKLSTIQSIGWYGLAFRLGGTAMALPAAVCSAMLPALSALYREDKPSFVEGTARLLNLMILCSIPFAAVMIFCPQPLIEILSHRTASFLPATNVVRVYGLTLILWFVSQAAFTGIIACDQQKSAAYFMGIAAALSLPVTAGCIFLTQRFYHNGAIGAAISDFLVEVFLLASYCRVLPKGVFPTSMAGVTIRALAAVAPLIILLIVLPARFGIYWAIPCVPLYALLCVQFRCINPKDRELMGRLIGKKLGLGKA